MITRTSALAAFAAVSVLLGTACDGVTGGPRKVVFSEGVCNSVRFLRMKVNQTNRIVIDNTNHSDRQGGLTVRLERFPAIVVGKLPANSTINDPLSTFALNAPAGEKRTLDIRPTFTGEYNARCGAVIAGDAVEVQLKIQVVE